MPWGLFASVFSVIFLAELPDKSTLTAMVLATRYPARGVFIGAAGAMVLNSLISVGVGSVLWRFIPAHIVHWVAGALFIVFGILLWRKKEEETLVGEKTGSTSYSRAISTAFGLVFLAEWGDITQLSTAAFAAKYAAPGTIFAAAALAECSGIALGITLGRTLQKKMPQPLMQKLAAMIFMAVGGYLLATASRI